MPKSEEKIRQKKVSTKILNLFYPPVCGICGKFSEEFLCKKCEILLKSQAKFKIEKQENEVFEEHLYIFSYEGIIRKMILNYKFQEKSYLYSTFVNFLLKNEKFFEFIKKYDTIVPVPISQKRQRQRGYNQSELIARKLAKEANLSLAHRNLKKIKNIIEQSKLNKIQRQRNIQGAYELRKKEQLAEKNILLFDDIYTTGSTVKECCKILKQAKPKKIGVLTLAKDEIK